MNRRILTSLLAACVCTAVITAQAPTPPAAQSPATAQASDQRAAKPASMTIEGCLQRNTMAPSATTGATGTSGSAPAGFILETSKPTGTSGSASATAIAPRYRLDADDSKLSPHVGHKVEIIGTLDDADKPSAASPSSIASAAAAPKLKVDSVRMLAAVCTPA